jgi:hypothetical protein
MRLLKTALIVSASLVSLYFVTPSYSATFSDLQTLIEGQNWGDAEELARHLDQSEGHGDFFAAYVAATRAINEGQCVSAVAILDALTVSKPNFVPAYELAYVCYSSLGDEGSASHKLDQLLAVMPEGPQRQVVQQLKRNLEGEDGLVTDIYFDVAPSTNADRQTSATDLHGLPITDSSRGHAGAILRGGIGWSKTLYRSNSVTLAGGFKVDAEYLTVDGLLNPRLTAELPVSFGQLDNTKFLATPFASAAFRGRALDYTSVGTRGVVSAAVTDAVSLGLSSSVYYLDYQERDYLDGLRLDNTLAVSWLLNPANLITLRGRVDLDVTKVQRHQTVDTAILARIDHSMVSGLLIGTEAELGRRFHSEAPPLSFGPDQTDTYFSVKVDLSHRAITMGPFMPSPYYKYTRQWSDNVFYEFESHDIGITLRAKL